MPKRGHGERKRIHAINILRKKSEINDELQARHQDFSSHCVHYYFSSCFFFYDIEMNSTFIIVTKTYDEICNNFIVSQLIWVEM